MPQVFSAIKRDNLTGYFRCSAPVHFFKIKILRESPSFRCFPDNGNICTTNYGIDGAALIPQHQLFVDSMYDITRIQQVLTLTNLLHTLHISYGVMQGHYDQQHEPVSGMHNFY